MRLLCPSCQKSITVSDADAGKETKCPDCGHAFHAPEFYSLAVEPPKPAPPPANELVPTRIEPALYTPPGAQPSGIDAPPAPKPEKEAWSPPANVRFRSLPITLKFVQWLPIVCLTAIFLLTFFKWVGMYPGGYKAYAQNSWQALFGTFSTDPVSEKNVFKLSGPLNEVIRANWWMLPYLILLLAAVALCWAGHVFRWLNRQVPSWLERFWHLRGKLLAALTSLTLLLLLIQMLAGFGLENAAYKVAIAQTIKAETDATPDIRTPDEEQTEAMKIDSVYGGFRIGSTFWLQVVVLLHLLALGGVVMENVLIRRGSRPEPRVGILW